jgi:hypothetical protein
VRGKNPVTKLVDEAVRLRSLGLGVFPVQNKIPKFKSWQKGGLRSEASIRKIFGRYADDAETGVTTGQRIEGGFLYVLDVDRRNGGAEALAALPELPETVMSQTGNGWHYWFRTSTPQPTIYRKDGLELKGAGGYVVVPPSVNRRWVRSPFEWEVAECPGFLLPDLISEKREPLTFKLNKETGEILLDLADPISKVLAAPKGDRRRTLLSQAGRVKWNVLQGRLSVDDARELLLKAALQTGLDEKESLRVIDYSLTRGLGRNASTYVVTSRVTPRDLEVLGVVHEHFKELSTHLKRDIASVPSDILSARYVASRAKLKHPPQAQRSLDTLVRVGLLWRNPTPKRLKPSQRPCHRYRPTWAGLSLA